MRGTLLQADCESDAFPCNRRRRELYYVESREKSMLKSRFLPPQKKMKAMAALRSSPRNLRLKAVLERFESLGISGLATHANKRFWLEIPVCHPETRHLEIVDHNQSKGRKLSVLFSVPLSLLYLHTSYGVCGYESFSSQSSVLYLTMSPSKPSRTKGKGNQPDKQVFIRHSVLVKE